MQPAVKALQKLRKHNTALQFIVKIHRNMQTHCPRLGFDVFMHWLCARYKLFLRLQLWLHTTACSSIKRMQIKNTNQQTGTPLSDTSGPLSVIFSNYNCNKTCLIITEIISYHNKRNKRDTIFQHLWPHGSHILGPFYQYQVSGWIYLSPNQNDLLCVKLDTKLYSNVHKQFLHGILCL